ncbi:hypothetical protein K505DRAFT_214 [Melanomma pulvis-pyrius CBS 109.77]|uniref:Uncharacterized protein n=1 Tax=Melanomma pulvis-pyrius CBS 109.77 TaxID=1314802 RepID=A0A6A6XXG8_9PLEO|nr:hypothetical protein K505DRAFT_214 [Melanomma pulvis-pyrius CBS 109.77]
MSCAAAWRGVVDLELPAGARLYKTRARHGSHDTSALALPTHNSTVTTFQTIVEKPTRPAYAPTGNNDKFQMPCPETIFPRRNQPEIKNCNYLIPRTTLSTGDPSTQGSTHQIAHVPSHLASAIPQRISNSLGRGGDPDSVPSPPSHRPENPNSEPAIPHPRDLSLQPHARSTCAPPNPPSQHTN